MGLVTFMLIFLCSLSYVKGQCGDSPVIDSEYLCASPVTITPSSTGFNQWPANGTYSMIFSFTARITNLCALGPTAIRNFLTISIDVGGTRRQLFRFTYNPTGTQLVVYAEDTAGPYTFLNQPLSSAIGVGDWVEFMGITFLNNNTLRCGIAAPDGNPRIGSAYDRPSPGWKLDSSTKFTWCSNLDGSNPFSCSIRDLRIAYGMVGTTRYYMGGMDSKIIGYYKLNEGTGTSLINNLSNSPMGPGYFGDSSLSPTASTVPTWSTTDSAVKFTSTTQFLTLPTFTQVPGNQLTAFKFTFQMYIKINTAPASIGQIIGIVSQGGTLKLGMIMDNTLKVGYSVLGTNQFSGPIGAFPQFLLSTWQLLTVSFQLRTDLQTVLTYLQIATTYNQGFYTLATAGSLTFTTTDKIRIGGTSSFLGEVASIIIMSPGSMPLPWGCNPGSTADMGIMNPPLPTRCTAPYALIGSECVECASGYYAQPIPQPNACPACVPPCANCSSETACLSCVPQYAFDSLSSTCISCLPGFYSPGGTEPDCIDCPSLCATCTSDLECQTCKLNSFLSSSLCEQCPDGTYSLGGAISSCADCPPECATCSSATTCLSCKPQFSFDSLTNTCSSCLPGLFSPGGTVSSCLNCPSLCTTCTSALECQTCDLNSFLSSSMCVQCADGTYSLGGAINSCTACVSPCATCSSATDCLSCTPQHSFDSLTNTCSNCLSGFYSPGGTVSNCPSIIDCPSLCTTCTSATDCQACEPNSFLSSTLCAQCPGGTYSLGGAITSCTACVSPCATCSSTTDCLSCTPQHAYDSLSNTCTSCQPGFFSPGGTLSNCLSCPPLCATCTSALQCQTCKPNSFLLFLSCEECPVGTYSLGGSTSSCTVCPPECTTCTSATECQTCNGNYYLDGSTCLPCPSGTYSLPFTTDTSCTVGGLGTFSPQIAWQVANLLSWFICVDSSFSIANGIISRLIQYIKFIDVGYSLELQAVFKSWNTDLISISIPEDVNDKIISREIPYLYSQYGVEPSFLGNFWGELVIIVYLFIIWVILQLCKRYLKSCSNSKKLGTVLEALSVSVTNALIVAMYVELDDITFCFALEVRSVLFQSEWSWISFIVSVISLIFGICLLTVHLWILLKFQRIKSSSSLTQQESLGQAQEFLKKYRNLAVLFEDLRQTTFPKHGFLLILVSRNIFTSIMIGTGISAYPLVVSILLCYSSCTMIMFLWIMNPFKDRISWVVQVFLEFCVLAANTCVLLLANLDVSNIEDTSYRDRLGAMVIMMNLLLNCASIAFLFYNVLTTIYKVLKGWFINRKKKTQIQALKIQPSSLRVERQEPEKEQRNCLMYTNDSSFERIELKLPKRNDRQKSDIPQRSLYSVYFPSGRSPIFNQTFDSSDSQIFSPPSKSPAMLLNSPKENKVVLNSQDSGGHIFSSFDRRNVQKRTSKDSKVFSPQDSLSPKQDTPPRTSNRLLTMPEVVEENPRERQKIIGKLMAKNSLDEDQG